MFDCRTELAASSHHQSDHNLQGWIGERSHLTLYLVTILVTTLCTEQYETSMIVSHNHLTEGSDVDVTVLVVVVL